MRDTINRLQGWIPDFNKPRANDMDLGGVLKPGWFNCNITFQSLGDAVAAAREFRSAGYVVELLDDVDTFSNASWLTVSKFADTTLISVMFRAVADMADNLNGDADTHWIGEG
jgi:hypothetical protein